MLYSLMSKTFAIKNVDKGLFTIFETLFQKYRPYMRSRGKVTLHRTSVFKFGNPDSNLLDFLTSIPAISGKTGKTQEAMGCNNRHVTE